MVIIYFAPGVLIIAFFLTFLLGNQFSFGFGMSLDISNLLQCFPQELIKENRQVSFIRTVLNRH